MKLLVNAVMTLCGTLLVFSAYGNSCPCGSLVLNDSYVKQGQFKCESKRIGERKGKDKAEKDAFQNKSYVYFWDETSGKELINPQIQVTVDRSSKGDMFYCSQSNNFKYKWSNKANFAPEPYKNAVADCAKEMIKTIPECSNLQNPFKS